jgi:TolB protein
VDSARPIGVVPFQWAGPGAAPEDIGGIVAADLRNSGKFNPLDRSRLPQQPGTRRKFNLQHGLRWVLMRLL